VAYVYLRKKKAKRDDATAAEPNAQRKVKRRAKRRPVYWMGFTDRHGDPKQESTGETDYTKAFNKAQAREKEERDIKDGVRPAVTGRGVLYGDIAERYIAVVVRASESAKIDEGRFRNHILPKFGDELATSMLPTHLDEYFLALQDPKRAPTLPHRAPAEGEPPQVKRVQSAQSVHHIRSLMSGSFDYARTAMQMDDLRNPVPASQSIGYQKARPTPIPLAWIEPLLAHVPRHYFALFVTALFTGFRKGELFGMKVRDFNLDTGMLSCRGSHGKLTNKSKKDRPVPLHERLLPLLRNTVAGRPPDAPLFEMPDLGLISPKTGKPIPARAFQKDLKLAKIMRTALKSAGIGGGGFNVVCRRGASKSKRWGCGYTGTRAVEKAHERCPECQKNTLWFSVILVEQSFKDLRSTFGTWVARTAGDVRAATILLGHSSVKVTEESYAELIAEQLRDEVNDLPFKVSEQLLPKAVNDMALQQPSAATYTSLTPKVSGPVGGVDLSNFSYAGPASYTTRPAGVEPATLGFEGQRPGSKTGKSRVAPSSTRPPAGAKSRTFADRLQQAVAPSSTPQQPRTYTSLTPLRPALAVMAGGGERLMSVSDVAAFLKVNRETVYDSIKRGDFPAVRYGSSMVRIRWADVEAFLARSSSPTPKGKS
jgi:excisionase family DNA binding protein